jgi:hypothetical protein
VLQLSSSHDFLYSVILKSWFWCELGLLKQGINPSQNIHTYLQKAAWKDVDKHPYSDQSTKLVTVVSAAFELGTTEVDYLLFYRLVEIVRVQNVLFFVIFCFGIWYGFKAVLETSSLNRKSSSTPHGGSTTILTEPDGLLMYTKNNNYTRVSNPHPGTHLLSFCHM